MRKERTTDERLEEKEKIEEEWKVKRGKQKRN